MASPGLTPALLPAVPSERCFSGNGTGYRGVASTAASGLGCLAWNSDLLYQELHVDSVGTAALLGLGPHAFCRSAPSGSCRVQAPLSRASLEPTPQLCQHPHSLLVLFSNPDKDEKPWCYVVKEHALSWEYCRLAACGAGLGDGWARGWCW